MLTSMAAIAVGCYFISGLPIIYYPPQLDERSPMNLLGLVGGAVALGKLIMWAITRTDLYKTLIDALKSVPEIKKMVENIEKAITEGARKQVRGKRNTSEEKEEKKEGEFPPPGFRLIAGAVGGALLGLAIAGPPGAILAGLVGLFLGSASEEEEQRRREEERRKIRTLILNSEDMGPASIKPKKRPNRQNLNSHRKRLRILKI